MARVAALYDLLAPLYERAVVPLHDLGVSRAAERALGGWPETVLEVGVGPGRGLAPLTGDDRRVVGVDLSRRMLGIAGAYLAAERAQASLACATVLELPFRAGQFDAVVSTLLLDLLSDAELPVAIGELARVAAPGGRLVLGLLRFANRLQEGAWMAAYRALPELVGRCRPVELERYLPAQQLRVIREEQVPGVIGMRVVTLVRTA